MKAAYLAFGIFFGLMAVGFIVLLGIEDTEGSLTANTAGRYLLYFFTNVILTLVCLSKARGEF